MPRRIEYEYLEEIGPYQVKYLREYGTVKSKTGKTSKRYCYFLCPRCGAEFIAALANIRTGSTRSCGCYKKQKMIELGKSRGKDISGIRRGKLVAIEPTDERRRGNIVWKCLCDCGNTHFATVVDFLKGSIQSCGCTYSFGEAQIKDLLIQMGINFISQKTFDDCRNPKTNALLYFDFYLPDYNCCIEYDGRQHFVENSFGKWDELEKVQYRDNIKNQYCKDNNIRLIRIPYTEKNKITQEYLFNKLGEEYV